MTALWHVNNYVQDYSVNLSSGIWKMSTQNYSKCIRHAFLYALDKENLIYIYPCQHCFYIVSVLSPVFGWSEVKEELRLIEVT